MRTTTTTTQDLPAWKHRLQLVARLLTPLFGLSVALLMGCGTVSEQVTTIIVESEVAGPVSPVPVHVVTPHSKNRVAITLYGSYQGAGDIKGVVEGSPPGSAPWLYPQDTLYYLGTSFRTVPRTPESNLTWNLPTFTGGLDLDIAWENVALTGGINVSSASGQSLVGWSAGLGIFQAKSKGVGIRLEAGILGQELAYEASTVEIYRVTVSPTWFSRGYTSIDTLYYRDYDKDMKLGLYGSLLVNTAYPDWPANIFLQASVLTQPLLKFEPTRRTDYTFTFPARVTVEQRSEASTSVVLMGVTPGIYFEPSPTILITGGVRFIFDLSNSLKEPSNLMMPFLQFSLSLPT